MTTPAQRTQAFLRGLDLLGRLAIEQGLTTEVNARAAEILGVYPTANDIEDWVASGLPTLPHDAAIAIDSASALFYQVPLNDGVGKTFKSLILDLQRHFPSPGSAADAARLGFFGGTREWLAETGALPG